MSHILACDAAETWSPQMPHGPDAVEWTSTSSCSSGSAIASPTDLDLFAGERHAA
jgi:hypothetical protein